MSSKYKFYTGRGRGSSRGKPVPTTNITFGNNVLEIQNNKRPTAAKSAGTVGRWGITSFTSLRSVSSNGSESVASEATNKRKVAEYPPAGAASPYPSVAPKAAYRPRKFFKSRNADKEGESQTSTPAVYGGPNNARNTVNQYQPTPRPQPIPDKPRISDASVESNLSSEAKPPIKLRIFTTKGTSQIVSGTEESGDESNDASSPVHDQDDEDEEMAQDDEEDKCSFRAQAEDQNPPAAQEVPDEIEMAMSRIHEVAEQREAANGQNFQQIEASDKATLEEADALLSNTFVDYSTTEKLLIDPKQILPTPTSSSKNIANDWYSDNEEEEENSTPMPVPDVAPQVPMQSAAPVEIAQPTEPEELHEEHYSQPEVHNAEKKGSIFKSRRLLSSGPKKRLFALYKHKWSDDKEEKEKAALAATTSQATSENKLDASVFDEDFGETPVLTRTVKRVADTSGDNEEITGFRCNKAAREYYTVVRDVKNAHQIQETGEFYVFNDDVDYILDSLADNNPIATRCLSAISLASKCMIPAFRMHLRAHNVVAKFFSALHDATSDPSLALCTATVMFAMSQDQLAMDLERSSLELMLNLLDTDANYANALDALVQEGISCSQLEKNKQKVREVCEDIKSKGHAKHLNLDNITVGNLAMETLLSLTSRRAGEWFKEELRDLGGLEHIVKTVSACCHALSAREPTIWSESDLAKMKKADRCLRVLFNLTSKNLDNQLYLLTYEGGQIIPILLKLLNLCLLEIPLNPISTDKESLSTTVRETLLSVTKFLVDLTHNSDGKALGSQMLGEQPCIVDMCLTCVLRLPHYYPEEKQFDVMVVGLCMLINMAEAPVINRELIMNSVTPPDFEKPYLPPQTAIDALIELFMKNEAIAKIEEANTDTILDSKKEEIIPKEEQATKTPDEIFNDIVEKLLQKAGRNMECNLIQAYISMLITYLVMDNKNYEFLVREKLPEKNFQSMLKVLKKFVNFMVLTISTVSKSRSIVDTERLIEYLKTIDRDHIKEEVEEAC
ncbi:protein wings apart-like [Cloeon dipterum]|uniref:protein wings apart-like n=1 Tax=Cloeon dipterum TaxID=197152 RepID=UPI00321FBA29